MYAHCLDYIYFSGNDLKNSEAIVIDDATMDKIYLLADILNNE